MSPIEKVIINKDVNINPIWIMRQAGRYLPEFRKIREKNTDFVKLCLDQDLSTEITLQPLKRFDLDAAIIFSDILMLPYGLGQKVEFKKNFGPILGELDINRISKIDEIDFVEKTHRIYKAIKNTTSTRSTVPNILKAVPVARRFTVESISGQTYLQFGYGSDSNLTSNPVVDPAEVVLQLNGRDYTTAIDFDPTKLIDTDKFGIGPAHADDGPPPPNLL